MNLSTVDLDGYISALHQVQREIISAALERTTIILPIPTGLESHVISQTLQACAVEWGTMC